MNRLVLSALVLPLLLPAIARTGVAHATSPSACEPSNTVLHAAAVPVPGLSTAQVRNATAIINAGALLKVPQRGQTIAVMTALEESALQNLNGPGTRHADALGLFQQRSDQGPEASRLDPTASAEQFYQALTRVSGWQNLPPTLAAHAAQRNLDPNVYAQWWSRAVSVFNGLTTGTGAAGLRNLAARAQLIADCEAATAGGRFTVNGGTRYVGPLSPPQLDLRAQQFAVHGGNAWFDRCQAFVAQLDGRPYSGYSTALDAWQTFEAEGSAHPLTRSDGVAPPIGAWLYYSDSTNPAGHVVTYLGNGRIASTDVFGRGRVGIGPASAITDGPWHMQYLGWAPPWGGA
ncbi:MAG: hypothetical protein JWQ32_757 [Marmoricola sp.]|nr:hypothetical protein [Marmoricola sp.]